MPPLPVTLQISADKDGDDWTDLTTVKTASIRMGGQAGPAGEVGTGFGFDFEDAAAAFELPARRRVRLLVGELGSGDFLLAQGRVTDKTIARRSPPVGDVRGFDTNLSDANAHLQGIPVHRWVRPAETDVARITALADEFLSGDPRPSTNLTQAYLSSSNPIDLPAKTYDSTNPAGVVADVCALTRKLFFVTTDDDIFYDADDSTAFAADLSVTDVDPVAASFEFAPMKGVSATQDGTEFYSGLRLMWGELGDDSVHDSDSTAEDDHDFWEEVVFGNSRTQTDALIELDAILAGRKLEEMRISFALLLTDAELLLLKYGQTFSFRSAATGILTPVTVRCARLTWSLVGLRDDMNLWRADIEAGFPKKLAPRLSRGTRRTTGQPVQPVGGNDLYTICHPTSFYLGTWAVDDDPSPAALLIPATAEGTSVTIGPATGSTTAVPGWIGGARYTVTDPGVFPFGVDVAGVLSGRIVVPAHADWTGVGPAVLRVGMDDAVTPSTTFLDFAIDDTEDLNDEVLEDNQAYYFKLHVGLGLLEWKIWRVGDTEPVSYSGSGAFTLDLPPNSLLVSLSWTDVSGPTPPGEFTIDQLTWCYQGQYPTAFAGNTYGPVFIGVADGSTSTFSLPAYPGTGYTPGSLMVFVDGVWQPVSETDTTPPGEFSFAPYEPDEEDEIYASFRVPSP